MTDAPTIPASCWLALLFCLAPASAAGFDIAGDGEAWASRLPPPRVIQVLLLSEGSDAVDEGREQRQITELQLLLDSFEIVTAPMPDPFFSSRPEREKAAAVEPMAESAGAFATVWVQREADTESLLCLFLAEEGRILAMSVDISDAAKPEAEIALAAWELLSRPRSPSEVPKPEEEPLAEGEAAALDATFEPDRDLESVDDEERAGDWSAITSLVSGGSVGGGVPPVLFGGGLAAEYLAESGWLVRAGLSGAIEPDAAVECGLQLEARIAPDLAAGYAWRIGALWIAPIARIEAPWSLYRVDLDGRDDWEQWLVNIRFAVDVELGVRVQRNLWLLAAAGLGMSAFRDLFERLSDRSVERAAIAEWGVAIGARVVL